jgi:hypothetical protein
MQSHRQTEEEEREMCEDIENFLENDKAAREEENDYTGTTVAIVIHDRVEKLLTSWATTTVGFI